MCVVAAAAVVVAVVGGGFQLWSVAYVQRRVDPTGRALVEVNRSRSERFPDFSFDAADEAEANPRVRLPFSSFVDHLLAPSPAAGAAAAAAGISPPPPARVAGGPNGSCAVH
jgi:hypothetical protein